MESEEIKSANESIGDILRSSMTDLAEKNKEAYELLLKKANEGFFEQHQTSGALKKLAKQLLDMSEKSGTKNES